MRLLRASPATWGITELGDFELYLLRKIQEAADPGNSERAQRRLFPDPINPEDDQDGSFKEDWSEFVADGLADRFKSDLEIVAEDVATFEAYAIAVPVNEDGEDDLPPSSSASSASVDEGADEENLVGGSEHLHRAEFPDDHAGSWLGALNQARLMLAEKYDLHPEEHNGTLPQSEPPVDLSDHDDGQMPKLDEIEQRWRANLQSQFYAMLQEWLIVRVLSGEGDTETSSEDSEFEEDEAAQGNIDLLFEEEE